jgi:hypothetical protein
VESPNAAAKAMLAVIRQNDANTRSETKMFFESSQAHRAKTGKYDLPYELAQDPDQW